MLLPGGGLALWPLALLLSLSCLKIVFTCWHRNNACKHHSVVAVAGQVSLPLPNQNQVDTTSQFVQCR